jgi:adenylate kinase family enzyme
LSRHSPRRVLVIGSGGAGKTTLSEAISRTTGLPQILAMLDELRGAQKVVILTSGEDVSTLIAQL